MKTIKSILSVFILFSLISFQGNAQLINRLGNAAKKSAKKTATRKAEEKVEEETEKATEKAIDKLFNKMDKTISEKSKKTESGETDSETGDDSTAESNDQDFDDEGKLNTAPPPDIESSYHFTQKIVYKMSSTDKKEGTSTIEYILWFPDNEKYMATQMGEITVEEDGQEKTGESMQMFTIMDNSNLAMITIMEEQKMAQIIPMESVTEAANEKVEENTVEGDYDQPNVKKTGRTKKIIGYSCEEYVSSSAEGDATFWLTDEVDMSNSSSFNSFWNGFGEDANDFELPDGTHGFMMEMHFKTKSSDSEQGEATIEVTEIKKEKKEVLMSNYQVLNMGNALKHLLQDDK